MIELLSLPRRLNLNVSLPNIKFQKGLPINSLPGWEHIPLNRKLPMLKCPGNQVIFSKNKIGQSFKHLKHEFDPSGHDKIPEYNPLHDSNLKTFYANERNLKRVRLNGEITVDNDVICNLKDFNEYRKQLHKSHLYYTLQEMKRLEAEQNDRLLISNAENIAYRDNQNLTARDHSYTKILYRKSYLEEQRATRSQRLYEKTLEKLSKIETVKTIKQTAIQLKKAKRLLSFQAHAAVRSDLQRKRLISLKKLFHFKKDRLHRNLQKLRETRLQHAQEKQVQSWEKRLAERIANQVKIERLLDQVTANRQKFMQNHKQKYQHKWSKIQHEIKAKSLKNRKKFNLQMEGELKAEPQKTLLTEAFLIAEFQGSFEKLLDSEVCEALSTALDLENKTKVPFAPDDPIYKAAQYIMQVILKNFKKDLSTDVATYRNVYERMEKFFDDGKKFVIFRATQIIASFEDRSVAKRNQSLQRNSFVSFSQIPDTIGISSYEINPFIEVKTVSSRKPTPAGSLASLIVDSTLSLVEKTNCTNLSRNDLVFIEHYVIKFKRELIVGMGRKVFASIHCHYEKKTIEVRQELLDVDRKFLLNQVTKSILGYAVNPLNFASILKLCTSALASDVIWALQRQLLKQTHDRRRISKPSVTCSCKRKTARLCLFCKD